MKLFKKLGILVASFAMGVGAVAGANAKSYSAKAETPATMAVGTNGSACTVNGKNGIKVGTSSKSGNMTITVGAGATSLELFAAAWNKEAQNLNIKANNGVVNPSSLELTADSGISGNSTSFTLSRDESSYKFTLSLSNITSTTTLTLAGSKRFVVWGAAYELGNVTKYTVTFESNGGSTVSSQSVAEGSKVVKPLDPTKSGYSFGGWYTDVELTTPFDFENTLINEDTTIYAKWLTNYTVSFETNGGSDVGPQTVADGQKVSRPANPNKDDFAFGGWYADEGLTIPFDFENTVIDSDTTIYAKWSNYNVVTFESNGGSTVSSQSVAEGSKVVKPSDPTKSGYSFGGWYADEGLTIPFDFENTVIDSDTTIYAKWDSYSDSLNLNGTTQYIYCGIYYLKLSNTPTTASSNTAVEYDGDPTGFVFTLVGNDTYTIGYNVGDTYYNLYCISDNTGLRFGTTRQSNEWLIETADDGNLKITTNDPNGTKRQISLYNYSSFRTYGMTSGSLTTVNLTPNPIVDTSSVEINPLSFEEIVIGGSEIIRATFEGKSIAWTSSNDNIASVSKNSDDSCTVTGVSVGSVTITATVGIRKDSVTIKVIKAPLPGDNISMDALTGVSFSSYTTWNKKIGTNTYSGTTYKYTANNVSCIQLSGDSNKNSGIVSTGLFKKAKSITVECNSKTTSGTLNVYGSNMRYMSAADLKSENIIGTISYRNGSGYIDLSDTNYAYIGVRPASGTQYIDRIAFEWIDTDSARDDSIFTFNHTELLVGETYGIRFEGYVSEELVDSVSEYGFVLTRKDGKKATLNTVKGNVSKLLSELDDERDGLTFNDGEAVASLNGFLCFGAILKNIPEDELISFYAYVLLDSDGDGLAERFVSPVSEQIGF